MEYDPRWKTTFDGRWSSLEDDPQWKMTFDGRGPSMEDDLQWKTTLHGRRPVMEGNLRDNLWWIRSFMKTPFNGRCHILLLRSFLVVEQLYTWPWLFVCLSSVFAMKQGLSWVVPSLLWVKLPWGDIWSCLQSLLQVDLKQLLESYITALNKEEVNSQKLG